MVPLEKEVLAQFVEVYDRIIKIEKDHVKTIQELEKEHVKTIQELEKKHEDNSNKIQFLKQKVEDLEKLTAPETCAQLVKQNITRGQDVFIDSDGVNHGKKQLLTLICTGSSRLMRISLLRISLLWFFKTFQIYN